MSLIVAAADASVSSGLVNQLLEIDGGAVALDDLQAVLSACGGGTPACVVCSDLDWAGRVTDAWPRVPVVLAATESFGRDGVLAALRQGVADVWILPMAADEMRARLGEIHGRLALAGNTDGRQLDPFGQALERDQQAGRYLQMGMLPPSPMAIEGYRFEHRILPSMILSGDFVDYFPITDRHFGFYAADVSGHGASSAFVTVLLKNFSRRLAREHRPGMLKEPGGILEWINRELLDQSIDKHVAMIFGIGDLAANEIALVNAGHYPQAVLVRGGDVTFVAQKGRPVGLFDAVRYETRVLKMAPGDRLVIFSDGVLDAMGPGELARKEARLLDAARAGRDMDGIWQALPLESAALGQRDDMTCLMIQRED